MKFYNLGDKPFETDVSFKWVEKNTVGHFLSKHGNLANLLLTPALLKKYRILITFLVFFSTQNLTIV